MFLKTIFPVSTINDDWLEHTSRFFMIIEPIIDDLKRKNFI
ncbi:hypothetical protein GGQ60_002130 [Pedobacter zeae]|uniref:Uncharacterized protein n=1 Tax=Pedobacter zeae TaxID=1737356 RepID=A0A7W6KAG3_9SPHI|nr:hypothetical protein [Pedobacter zeae]